MANATHPFDQKLKAVVGDRTAASLEKELNLQTLEDLIRHYPRRYEVRGELTDIEALELDSEVTILAKVESAIVKRIPGRKGGILEAIVTDGRAKLILTFFNQAWRLKDLKPGVEALFSGKVGLYKGKRQLTHPDYMLIPEGNDAQEAATEFAGKYLPVYTATRKLPSWKVAQCIGVGLAAIHDLPEPLPEELLQRLGLPSLASALREVHNPSNLSSAQRAKERLTFDEALLMQLFLAQRRIEIRSQLGVARRPKRDGVLARFDAKLPFELTAGQRRIAAEIERDLTSDHPMYRLLQGDVGSGKTMVALRAMLSIVDAGAQAALLAPTEVLAQQHYKNFQEQLGEIAFGGMLDSPDQAIGIALLTGSSSAAERKLALTGIATGAIGIIVGTHALLSENVEFKDLGLIVVDEQHRFGVEQRDALRAKAERPPHVLVMTATPIPRTVAMTVFGDLDVSTLTELPLGRSPITSHLVKTKEKPQYLERAWQRVREEVEQGRQVFVVAPRISSGDDSDFTTFGLTAKELQMARRMSGETETSEKTSMHSVAELFPMLHSGPLAGLRLAQLHGRLPADEKERTMGEFAAGKIDVLVTTTVIEVGVDVPNASMMVIMDADRFGVSQLHQLRGRIGRGSIPGLCLFVTDVDMESPALARLEAVAATTDGFELSRLDLEQRREGDVLGSAQSGATSHLRLLRVIRDESLIEKARTIADEILARNPHLSATPALRREVDRLRQEERANYLEKK